MSISRAINSIVLAVISAVLSPVHMALIHYGNTRQKRIFDICRRIRNENRTLLSVQELYVLYTLLRQTESIPGDIAEVGVYKGGSAKLLCLGKKNKLLHLFDTFIGLPDTTIRDDAFHKKGMYAGTYEQVRQFLAGFQKVIFHKGLFQKTASSVQKRKFSFVHLDVDLFDSTLSALRFFYPRMNRRGIIITHDYPTLDGVRSAFEKFASEHRLVIIEISPTQAVLMKV